MFYWTQFSLNSRAHLSTNFHKKYVPTMKSEYFMALEY